MVFRPITTSPGKGHCTHPVTPTLLSAPLLPLEDNQQQYRHDSSRSFDKTSTWPSLTVPKNQAMYRR